MKKSYTTRLLASLTIVIILAPIVASASTLSLSPGNINVTQGQVLTVNVALNPLGVKNYTVKMEMNYPAQLLEVQSFAFANNWIPLSQTGYDLIDNANGVLIKSAGYPAGVSSPTIFGTITFRAKANGNGNISVRANSFAYNSDGQNILTGVPLTASVVISPPAPVPVQTPASVNQQRTPPTTATEQEEVVVAEDESSEVSEVETQPSLLANVGSAMTFGTGSIMAGLIFLIILVFAGYGAYSMTYKIRNR